jgi:hypothetical protein
VESGGDSDHHPIFLELARGTRKPVNPFKFNSEWLKEEIFMALVKEHWIPFDPSSRELVSAHFSSNLKMVKQATITWEHKKIAREEKELKEIEDALKTIFTSTDGGLSSPETKDNLLQLEKKKRKILEDKEATRRLKSREI